MAVRLRVGVLPLGIWALFAPIVAGAQTAAVATPSYRARILGVFDAQSGEPIEGAEVIDALNHVTATTTKTGTVSLAFLPEGASMLRIQKIGFKPVVQFVEISPADTVPVTILMVAAVQTLPTVVTTDSSLGFLSPGLRAFEERRKLGGAGRFVTEAELRKQDNAGPITNVIRGTGTTVKCTPRSPVRCFAVSNRAAQRQDCPLDVYYDGQLITDANADLQLIRTDQVGAVEIYDSIASLPVQYNRTSKGCGVMLLWSRFR